jgi:putative transposase
MLFFNKRDLQKKLDAYRDYYNETRAHSSLNMQTPKEIAVNASLDKKIVSLKGRRWQSYCHGLYKFPVAAQI